ncbi:hypothetical protein CI610_02937 [invertebrate metagenome]|uniref:Telomere resolvase ResT/TelK catalytic domain-containing protein n=1 Tax=invertebrate metagenome TaxID=1711999 RepID=A0A2H9T4K4_9ZZZZ
MDVIKSKHENTKQLVDYLVNLQSKRPTDSINKKVSRELKALGIEMKSSWVTNVNAGGRKRKELVTDYKHDPDVCEAATAREVIRHYKNAILDLGMLNHAYIKTMKSLKSELESVIGACDDVKELYQFKDIKRIRNALKRLYRKCRGSKLQRAMLDNVKPEHHAYYKLHGASQRLNNTINENTETVLRQKHDRRIRINPDYAIDIAHKILLDKKAKKQEKAVALIIVTGRRPTEILKTATLKKHTDDMVLFDGQLKTRDRHIHETLTAYHIPLITSDKCNQQVILNALKSTQLAYKNIEITYPDILGNTVTTSIGDKKRGKGDIAHNRAVTQWANSTLNSVIRGWFDTDGITCKSLRAAYSEIAYLRLPSEKQKGTSKDAYAASILGYGEHGFGAARNYAQIALDTEIERAEKPDDADKAENQDSELVDGLKRATDVVLANKRAKASHALHAKLVAMAEKNLITRDELTAGRLSRVPVNGKRINIDTVRKYLLIIAGYIEG